MNVPTKEELTEVLDLAFEIQKMSVPRLAELQKLYYEELIKQDFGKHSAMKAALNLKLNDLGTVSAS